jgi:uncharacterized OB-fold protein
VGFVGAAQPLLNLAGALPALKDGRILLCALGAGAGAALLKAEAKLDCPWLEGDLARTHPIGHYRKFLRMRDFHAPGGKTEPIFSSQIMLHRDRDLLLRLQGTKCKECGLVHAIPIGACQSCGGTGTLEPMPLGRKGKVFTFTHEYYIPTPEPPVTMIVADLDGGGRILVQAADIPPKEVKTGMPIRLTLRLMHMGGGYPNYYWKAVSA